MGEPYAIQVMGGPAQPMYIAGPKIDEEGALTVIGWEHHQIHDGEIFTVEHSASVNNAASMDIRIAPSLAAATECHLAIQVNTGGQVAVYFYESPTQSGGTALAEYNFNRKSARTNTWSFLHTPAVSAVGTTPLVNGRLLPGGASQQTRIGGGVRPGIEWLLHNAKEYLLRITNTSGGAIVINPVFEFYEE